MLRSLLHVTAVPALVEDPEIQMNIPAGCLPETVAISSAPTSDVTNGTVLHWPQETGVEGRNTGDVADVARLSRSRR